MKKGTIFRNLWAGYETYFVYMHPVRSGKNEPSKVGGYCICKDIDGKWNVDKNAVYYAADLKDDINFPEVGLVDMEEILLNGILGGIDFKISEKKKKERADR